MYSKLVHQAKALKRLRKIIFKLLFIGRCKLKQIKMQTQIEMNEYLIGFMAGSSKMCGVSIKNRAKFSQKISIKKQNNKTFTVISRLSQKTEINISYTVFFLLSFQLNQFTNYRKMSVIHAFSLDCFKQFWIFIGSMQPHCTDMLLCFTQFRKWNRNSNIETMILCTGDSKKSVLYWRWSDNLFNICETLRC